MASVALRPCRQVQGDAACPAAKPGLGATLAALRAQCAGRKVAAPVANFDRFRSALAAARFPVFLFSGHGRDALALEMLQGLVADLNRTARASGLHLPASESGWGSALASTWMTGFPLRTGFARGFPEFDPWRFDVARMIAAGEADLHLWISGQADRLPITRATASHARRAWRRPTRRSPARPSPSRSASRASTMTRVVYSARTGSLAAIAARRLRTCRRQRRSCA